MNVDSVGFIAFAITVIYTVLGLPAQIIENYRRKSMSGISLFMNIVLLFVFSSWVIYGALKEDWYILGSNAPGAICIAAVLWQFYLYREREKPK